MAFYFLNGAISLDSPCSSVCLALMKKNKSTSWAEYCLFISFGKTLIIFLRLEPLLARIKEDRTAVLCPEIDLIDKDTLEYGGTGSYSVGGFWWSLHFSWRPISPREKERRAAHPEGSVSPIRYTSADIPQANQNSLNLM